MTVQTIETGSALAIRADQREFTPAQVAALRQLGVSGATEGDLQVFFHQAQRTGLDPFARQLYMIGRSQWNPVTRQNETKQTIQTGIDGFRLIARRASDHAREPFGYEDTLWCGPDGRWTDVWLSPDAPAAAKVTVLRNGQRFPAVALFGEYAGLTKDGKPTRMWSEKGALMLAKCAEALALRKAFPQDLSGLYTADEMARADSREAATDATPKPDVPAATTSLAEALGEPAPVQQMRTPQQARMLGAALKELGMSDPTEALAFMGGIIGHPLSSTKDLTADECADVLDRLRGMAAEAERLAAEDDVMDAELVDPETGELDGPMIPGAADDPR